MKLFRITLDDWNAGPYDGCMIAAESEEHIKELLLNDKWLKDQKYSFYTCIGQKEKIEEVRIEEIKSPCILLTSCHDTPYELDDEDYEDNNEYDDTDF